MSGWLAVFAAPPAWTDPAQVDQLVTEWLTVEAQEAAMQRHWREQKPMLMQRQTLLKREIAQLNDMLANNAQGEDEVSQQRAKLAAEQTALERAQTQTVAGLKQLEAALEAMAPGLPPPVASAWQAETADSPEAADTSKRLQVALAKLARLKEFDQRVSVHRMPLTDASGDKVMVHQIYLGAAQAWFVTPDGTRAGTGQVRQGEWQWQWQAQMAPEPVRAAIASFEKTAEPARIQLPVELPEVNL